MFIRNINLFIVPSILFFVGIFLVSCAGTSVSSVKGTEQSITKTAAYKGPKARIAVASIKCKAAKCNGQIGSGLRDMLISALANSNRFIVLGGSEELQELEKEINLSQSGYIRQESAIQPGGWEAADIIVLGSITAFEPNAGGIGAGGIGIPLGVPLIGGVKFGKKEAYIAMDLRLVDVRTRRIVAATTVEGKASSFNVGGLGAGFTGGLILGGGLSVYKNTPMEKAVRVLIDKSVDFIAKRTPEEYYRYTPEGKEINSTQPPVNSGVATKPTNKPTTPVLAGGIKRAQVEFEPGSKVLFSEDFSNCTEKPTTLKVVEGDFECVEFGGRKWLVNIVGSSKAVKKVNLGEDFAIEFDIYVTEKPSGLLSISLGSDGRGGEISFTNDYVSTIGVHLLGKELTKRLSRKTIHHVAIQKKENFLRLFVDGNRLATEEIDPIRMSQNNDGFVIVQRGNINEGNYFLITNIRVTSY
ncbi:CsgG/HfaB family protein [Hydrogenothermus marinus]|uniref:Curli biogenesis system outer membrane secretion channel CsgG n=1 Tax=Hydrogenothermus marinus TaxID=133270 RepID=A0A3M0BKZ0_9AQUI|nr:CsgG/HfaB family protein [Hydrogenothermus marinus]RMA97921.1 curli biogenesis system outer membrane secretion channel CsgG [Hydrogenothermus marinus]